MSTESKQRRVMLRCPNPDCEEQHGGLYFSMTYDEGDDSLTFECEACGHSIPFSEVTKRIAEGEYPDYGSIIEENRDEVRQCIDCGKRVLLNKNPFNPTGRHDSVFCTCRSYGPPMMPLDEPETHDSSFVDSQAMEWLVGGGPDVDE